MSIETRKSRQLRFGAKGSVFLSSTWPAISPSPELTRSESVWHVQSNMRTETVLKFMRLRWFWKDFEPEEEELFFSQPRFLNDVEFNVILALLGNTELSRKEISEKMEKALNLLGKKSNFRHLLLPQWSGRISVIADLVTRTIGKHKAFSGWVRNSSSVGSKRRGPSIPEPISDDMPEIKFDEYNFLYELISVGSIETSLGIIRLP